MALAAATRDTSTANRASGCRMWPCCCCCCFLSAGLDYRLLPRGSVRRPEVCRISGPSSTLGCSTFHMESQFPPPQRQPPLASVSGHRHVPRTTLLYSTTFTNDGGDGSAKPPAYNGNDIAADVFKDPYFYDSEEHASDTIDCRAKHLGNRTIHEWHQRVVEKSDGFWSLARRIDAIPDCVEAYLEAADIRMKQSIAEAVLKKLYECDFLHCTISVGDDTLRALDPLVQDGERMMNLDFLNALRLDDVDEDNFFIPKSIYLRDSMRKIFGLFQQDIRNHKRPGKLATALIGSPGVGKSVLFFLAALYCAQSISVVYFLYNEGTDKMCSVFMLTPSAGGSVSLWYTRNVAHETLTNGLSSLCLDLERKLGIHHEDYYTFLDGPRMKHSYAPNLLYGEYDYFCTSGGFPRYKNEEKKKRLWILDGWTEREAIEAFARNPTSVSGGIKVRGSLNRTKARKAKEVYMVCGGNIQEMKRAWEDDTMVTDDLDALVTYHLDANVVQLVDLSTERGNPKTNSDRLRTMFAQVPDPSYGDTWKWRMQPYQIVDSRYLLTKLLDLLESSKFFGAYVRSRSYGFAPHHQDIIFECMIHHCIMKCMRCQPAFMDNTSVQGVNQLVRPNMYWMPSVSNFPNINSAIIVNNTVHAFSMTNRRRKTFKIATFKTQFLNRVKKKSAFSELNQQVYVHYLIPGGTRFNAPDPVEDITFLVHHIGTTSVDDVLASVREVLVGLGVVIT